MLNRKPDDCDLDREEEPTITHIAGIVVRLNNCVIQRCCVCGERLVFSNKAVEDDGTITIRTWPQGTFVREKNKQHFLVSVPDEEELPSDLCLSLVDGLDL